MRVKIISDGTSKGTRVIDEQSGEAVEGCVYLSWIIDKDHMATATITLVKVSIDASAETNHDGMGVS